MKVARVIQLSLKEHQNPKLIFLQNYMKYSQNTFHLLSS